MRSNDRRRSNEKGRRQRGKDDAEPDSTVRVPSSRRVSLPQLTSDNSFQPRGRRTVAPSDRITRYRGRISPFQGEIIEDVPGIFSCLRQRARKPRRLRLTPPKRDAWAGIKRINCRYEDHRTGNTKWHRGPGIIETLSPVAAARKPWYNKR